MIVPGGGLSPSGNRWVACKPGFFLHVRVLSRLFRRLLIEGLLAVHRTDELRCGKAHDASAITVFDAVIFPLERDGVGIGADQAAV